MSKRRKNGALVRVAAPQTVGEGRASRAKDARPIPLRRLDGEEGALAKLVFALGDPALFGKEGTAKDKAQERVRVARKRVRSALGDERQAKEVFALASVSAGERRVLSTAHDTLAPHLVEQSVAAMRTMREFHVESWTARSEVAVAARLLATGLAILDEGSTSLDVEKCKAAAALLGQAQRMRDGALDTDRRAKAARPAPTMPWLTAHAETPPEDEATSEHEGAPSLDVGPSEAIEAPTDDDDGKGAESAAEPSTRRERDTRVSPSPTSEPDPEPRVRLPGSTFGQRRDGSWGEVTPVRVAAPGREAVAKMAEQGLVWSHERRTFVPVPRGES